MLNLHTFPLVPYPGLAPELALRAGMGGWEAYALTGPTDRLLPFALARPRTATGSAWINCAWIEHADDPSQRFATLLPTGATATTPPPFSLVLSKVIDPLQDADYFLYAGATIAGLNLPCAVPLRLVLDGAWQSPRFSVATDLSGYMLVEWFHKGPLAGIPYGTGLRQRLYVAQAALNFAAPREESEVSKDSSTGAERIDFLALWRTANFVTEPLPTYLSEALSGLRAHSNLLIDGEAWRAREVKGREIGDGRASMTITVEQQQVVIRRAGPAPALTPHVFDATADAPRLWRCGQASDTAPDWQTTSRACSLAADGTNTGLVDWQQRDINPYSATKDQTRTVAGAETDLIRCPVPIVFRSASLTRSVLRNNCATGQSSTPIAYTLPAGQFTSPASQAAADAAAQIYADANAQAYANANGACTVSTAASYRPVYQNGCFACLMVNTADASDIRDATAAENTTYFRSFADDGNHCLGCN